MNDTEGFQNVPPLAASSQGESASRNGAIAAAQVESLLRSMKLCPDTKSKRLEQFVSASKNLIGNCGSYAKNLPVGICSYGDKLRLPFVVYLAGWDSPLGIDIHSQAVSGSAKDKIVKTARDLVLPTTKVPSILLLTGEWIENPKKAGGVHECVRFFMRYAKGKKLLRLFIGDSELRQWFAEGMKWPADMQTVCA